jgi:PE-PPE domain/PE family
MGGTVSYFGSYLGSYFGSYLGVQPDQLATAATDLTGIRTAVASANAASAAQTTNLLAAASDEVSAATATLFNSYGQDYLRVVAVASAFHEAFERALTNSGLAYAETEAANAAAELSSIGAPIRSLLGGASSPSLAGSPVSGLAGLPPTPVDPVALIMGGSGMPTPTQGYINTILKYVAFPYTSAQGLYTPESLYPLTGYNTAPLSVSVAKGVALLDTAIKAQIAASNNVTVLGYSQSSIISSLEMNSLASQGNPNPGNITFTLLGNPMNPNGGLFSRFAGLNLPSIGLNFYGATPSSTPYHTNVVTAQYDGYADFPRYPLNFLSDLNAMAGIVFIHGGYGSVDPFNLPTGFHLVSLPTSSADVATNYYMITVPGLPLLEPLRVLPIIGNPLADLVQPDLTYLVNLGYGDPHYGYSTGYADVPTAFGLFPSINPLTLAGDLVTGAGQGAGAFVGDIVGGLASLANPAQAASALASVTMPSFTLPALAMPTMPIGASVIQGAQQAASGGVPLLTPLADLAAAAFISVPQYDVTLFAQGMQQLFAGDPVGLINAFGNPVAATTGLETFLATWALATVLSEI